MADIYQVAVLKDEDAANILGAKLKIKGYAVAVEKVGTVVLDGLDLGGSHDTLADVDGETWIVIASK